MDKLQIIQLLLEKYIRDPSARAIQNGIPRYVTYDGRMCPMGSIMKDKRFLDTFGNVYTLVSHSFKMIPGVSARHISFLPPGIIEPYYDGHQTNFWSDLTLFHDTDKFFTKTGLSEEGKNYLKFIEAKWEQTKDPKL